MRLSAIVERSGGAFLFAGDGAKEYIGNHYKGDKMVGWLLWSPETLELLEKLNPNTPNGVRRILNVSNGEEVNISVYRRRSK